MQAPRGTTIADPDLNINREHCFALSALHLDPFHHQLHLEDNNIGGTIPQHIGNLTSLKYLLLQRNNLTGCIPSSIGKLKKLQVS
jgi:hypothetical protein